MKISEIKNIKLYHISESEDWITYWNTPANLLSSMSLKREEKMELELHEAVYLEERFYEINKSMLPPGVGLWLSRK